MTNSQKTTKRVTKSKVSSIQNEVEMLPHFLSTSVLPPLFLPSFPAFSFLPSFLSFSFICLIETLCPSRYSVPWRGRQWSLQFVFQSTFRGSSIYLCWMVSMKQYISDLYMMMVVWPLWPVNFFGLSRLHFKIGHLKHSYILLIIIHSYIYIYHTYFNVSLIVFNT